MFWFTIFFDQIEGFSFWPDNNVRKISYVIYFSSVSHFEPILDYYRDLAFAVGIVDDLNLNTRIWTRE
jgi:hypothetical protein